MHQIFTYEFPVCSIDNAMLDEHLRRLGCPFSRRVNEDTGLELYRILATEEQEGDIEYHVFEAQISEVPRELDFYVPAEQFFVVRRYLSDNELGYDYLITDRGVRFIVECNFRQYSGLEDHLLDHGLERVG